MNPGGADSSELYPAARPAGWLMPGVFVPFLALVFVIATALLGDVLLGTFVRLDAKGNPVDMNGLVAFTLLPFTLMGVVLIAWVRAVERGTLANLGLGDRLGPGTLRSFARGWLVGVGTLLLVVGIASLIGGFVPRETGWAWQSPVSLLSILALLASFAVQASAEELLFRGWLLPSLARKFNVATGIVVSSAVFALLHFSRGQALLVTIGLLLFGVFCALWAWRARSIAGVMGWHSGWNWLLAVGFGLPLSGLDVGIPALLLPLQPVGADWLTGGAQGPEGSIVCVVFFIVGCAVLLRRRRMP
jgi:uncharacterized protein